MSARESCHHWQRCCLRCLLSPVSAAYHVSGSRTTQSEAAGTKLSQTLSHARSTVGGVVRCSDSEPNSISAIQQTERLFYLPLNSKLWPARGIQWVRGSGGCHNEAPGGLSATPERIEGAGPRRHSCGGWAQAGLLSVFMGVGDRCAVVAAGQPAPTDLHLALPRCLKSGVKTIRSALDG